MPAPDGPQFSNEHWTRKWLSNISENEGNLPKTSYLKSYEEPIYQWVNSNSMFGRHKFPTEDLQRVDANWAEYGHKRYWDSNPEVARRQKPLRSRPKVEGWSDRRLDRSAVDTTHPDFIHKMMEGTGAPEHVTVYHHGDIPDDAEYASGSVDPNWPEAVKSGWAARDPSINRGRLHIYLVPHEDILHAGTGSESEVFFRRGLPFNKTKRSARRQRKVESVMEEVIEHDWEPVRNEQGRFRRV